MGQKDRDCVEFLQWALPRLRMRWDGFRRVRGQVCKRLYRRMEALGLDRFEAYRDHLTTNPAEWVHLDALCRITISRFYRDRGIFDRLASWLIEAAPRAGPPFRAWSIGCASGEEPYTLSLIWHFRVRPRQPQVPLHILATDSDSLLLERARRACYRPGSLRELPDTWVQTAFHDRGGELCLGEPWRRPVELRRQDLRESAPPGMFDLILCRNLAFTYFEPALQREMLDRLAARLWPGGMLMLGAHETLPEPHQRFDAAAPPMPLYRRREPA